MFTRVRTGRKGNEMKKTVRILCIIFAALFLISTFAVYIFR